MRNCLSGSAAGIVAICLMSVSAYAQVSPAAPVTRGTSSTWTPARTPDGQPDIQGIWEGGASFVDPQGAKVQVNVGPSECNTFADVRGGRTAVNTPCAAYPALWTTGQRSGIIGSPSAGPAVRSGLIDPPDGNLPWNPEGKARREDIVKHIYDPPTLAYLDPHARCMLPGVP